MVQAIITETVIKNYQIPEILLGDAVNFSGFHGIVAVIVDVGMWLKCTSQS